MPNDFVKVTLRLKRSNYEYLRAMAESKFDYGGLNLIIREVLNAFVENAKLLEEKHRNRQKAIAETSTSVEAAE